MNTKEIITLQFGHYPNFVGAHWWNIQEAGFQYSDPNTPSEVNHDVLYREGLTLKNQVTFTPRLLLADLKGSLKGLSQYNSLYDTSYDTNAAAVPWDENAIEVRYEDKPPKNELQEALAEEVPNLSDIKGSDLEKNVEVWSDFLYARYHPRTVNIVNEYRHESTDNQFEVFNLGCDVWKADFGDEFSDRIRNYIEECDNLQGFHVLLEPTSAFGGLTASCLEHLKDEYSTKSVLSVPVLPSYYSDYSFNNALDREKSTIKDSIRLINLLLSLDSVSDHSCLTIPLCAGTKGWRQPGPKRNFKYIKYKQESAYHTSALLAAALDTLTMPYRLKSNAFTISDFCSDLNIHGRKICAASLQLPFGIKAGEDLIDCLDKWNGPLWECLTPNCTIELDKTLQHVTLRGVPLSRLKRPLQQAERQRQMPAYKCDSVKNMMEYYFQCTSFYTVSHVTSLNSALPVKIPFPDIFDEYVDMQGNISTSPRTSNDHVESVPAIAGCHSGAKIGEMLDTLHRESGRIKIARFPQFKTSGLEDDEYKECLNRILDLRDCYEEF